jgi:hypothetical protein
MPIKWRLYSNYGGNLLFRSRDLVWEIESYRKLFKMIKIIISWPGWHHSYVGFGELLITILYQSENRRDKGPTAFSRRTINLALRKFTDHKSHKFRSIRFMTYTHAHNHHNATQLSIRQFVVVSASIPGPGRNLHAYAYEEL